MEYKVINIVDLDTTKMFEFHENLLGYKKGSWFCIDENGYPINRFEDRLEAESWLKQYVEDINSESTMSLEEALEALANSLEK